VQKKSLDSSDLLDESRLGGGISVIPKGQR
jgi:hypothetical protein